MRSTASIPPLEHNLVKYAHAFDELGGDRRPSWLPTGLTPIDAVGILGMIYYAVARTGKFSYPEREDMEKLSLACALISSQLSRYINGGYDHFERDFLGLPSRLRGPLSDDPMLEDFGDLHFFGNRGLRERTFAAIRDRFDRHYDSDPTGLSSIRTLADFGFAMNAQLVTGIGGSKIERVGRDLEILLGRN